MIRFGISGLPPEDGDDAAFLDGLVARGHTAFELGFTKGFPWKEPRCERFGKLAADRGIDVSLHAPYFAILTGSDEDKAKLPVAAVEHSMKLGRALGARIICAHIGVHGEREPHETMELVRRRLDGLAPKIAELGVALGFETSGNDNNFGSIGDLAILAEEFSFVYPLIDWAHVHAATRGALTSPEAFDQVLGFVLDSFDEHKIDPLQCQFSDNEFGDRGEIRHVRYGDGTLRVSPLIEAAWDRGVDLVMISESRDDESHDEIFAEAAKTRGQRMAADDGRPIGAHMMESPRTVQVVPSADRWRVVRARRPLSVSNIDKEMFPGQFTKGDVIQYYAGVAPILIPHLLNRPISMNRFPDGIDGKSFFEKRAPGHQPEWMDTATVYSNHNEGDIDFLLANNRESIMWFANMGCLEFHPFHSRADDLDHPDYAIFDLDPAGSVTWDQMVDAAELLHTLLDQLGLKAFPKLSGSKGIHVYVPVARTHSQARVRNFVHAVGTLMAAANPADITMEWDRPKRGDRVFVDAFRNATAQTVASVYSVRPLPGAPVSAPVRWDELGTIRNGDVTIANIWERLASHGDLFAGVLGGSQDLSFAEEALQISSPDEVEDSAS